MRDIVLCPYCRVQFTLEEYGRHTCFHDDIELHNPNPPSITPPKPKEQFCHIHTTFKEYENCECYPAEAIARSELVSSVVQELDKAITKFPPFHSAHEGYAILYEEVCELWEVVREKQSTPGREDRLRKECIQVAAMAMRFLHDMKGFKN